MISTCSTRSCGGGRLLQITTVRMGALDGQTPYLTYYKIIYSFAWRTAYRRMRASRNVFSVSGASHVGFATGSQHWRRTASPTGVTLNDETIVMGKRGTAPQRSVPILRGDGERGRHRCMLTHTPRGSRQVPAARHR
jgi:hypothetical protein